jgi:hypothetical protein
MVWRLQEVWLGTHEVNTEVFWDVKPNVFMVADYVPSIDGHTTLLSKGEWGVPGHAIIWCLEEIEIRTGGDTNQAKWAEFKGVISRIEYKPGWYFRTGVEIGGPDGSRMWVQVGVTEEAEISWDMVEGKKVPWRGAKHYLSAHMCRNEIVSTVYHAIERAELHEVKEWFRYAPEGKKPRSIFNPHLDPDALSATAAKASSFDTRENAMTMDDPS